MLHAMLAVSTATAYVGGSYRSPRINAHMSSSSPGDMLAARIDQQIITQQQALLDELVAARLKMLGPDDVNADSCAPRELVNYVMRSLRATDAHSACKILLCFSAIPHPSWQLEDARGQLQLGAFADASTLSEYLSEQSRYATLMSMQAWELSGPTEFKSVGRQAVQKVLVNTVTEVRTALQQEAQETTAELCASLEDLRTTLDTKPSISYVHDCLSIKQDKSEAAQHASGAAASAATHHAASTRAMADVREMLSSMSDRLDALERMQGQHHVQQQLHTPEQTEGLPEKATETEFHFRLVRMILQELDGFRSDSKVP